MENQYTQTIHAVIGELGDMMDTICPMDVERFINMAIKAKRVFFAAAGRSRLMLSAVAMRFMHIGMTVHVVGEASAPAITEEDILVVASGSGETSTVVNIAQKAKAIGAAVALITLHEASGLAKISDVCLHFSAQAGKESVQIGAAAFEQATLLMGDTLVCLIADRLRIVDPNGLMRRLHANLE